MLRSLITGAYIGFFVAASAVPTAVYRSSTGRDSTTNFVAAGGITNGSTAERGDLITLAPGTPRNVTELTVYYVFGLTLPESGTESFQIRFFAADGPPTGGSPTPGTLLWESGQIDAKPGLVTHRIEVPSVVVPDTFFWTFKAENVPQIFPTPQDPTQYFLGTQMLGPPQIGTSDLNLVRRNEPSEPWQVVAYPSQFGNQAPPGTPPPCLGITIWADGGPAIPYDSMSGDTMPTGLAAIPETLESGDDVSFEGANRTVGRFEFEYGVDIATPTGSEGVVVRFYQYDETTPGGDPAAAAFWTSPTIPINTNAGFHTLSMAVPAVEVPDRFAYTLEWINVSQAAGNEAGQTIRTPPNPGGSSWIIWRKDGLGPTGWGAYWFGNPSPSTDPGLEQEPVANFAARFLPVAELQTAMLAPGATLSNGPEQLAASDDQRWVMRPGVVLTSAQDPIGLVISANLPVTSAAGFSIIVEGNGSAPGIRQTAEAYNFQSGSYDSSQNTTMSVNTDSETSVDFAGSDHVGPANEIRVRLKYRATGPVLIYPWQLRLDRVYFNFRLV
jgi:hypothetical protein